MIRQQSFDRYNRNTTVLKINPIKLKELLPAFEVNTLANSITIFTKVEQVSEKEKIIYAEKSAMELAFEEFEDQ
ncbi:hypothetical protein [Pedobacter sp. Leaf194]|uniref:hypothetical protein n=1 Tax=Pedobacter sp. Leaf194 TaxID=1736297 RepID=UPI0007035EA3|nr:hypothetical protein [Pedobacter sp. Leaf194]KQS40952.1 hypothetical protein ASG14_00225 [Pedobacter sp. Leaf194]RYD79033.1 MAG: hypothetical protein EOP55_05720 [Sphingobacteriales bacterium]